MSNFVTDLTTLPNGKSDLTVSPVPANNKVTATEWNTTIQACYDLRSQLLAGNYHGFTNTTNTEVVAGAGLSKLRQNLINIESSIDGGSYHILAEKDPGVYNVKSFGAKGDGTTDDILAFEAALAAMQSQNSIVVPTARTGQILYVPKGRYRLSRTLYIDRAITLVGTGTGWFAGSVLKFDANNHGLVFMSHEMTTAGGRAVWSTVRDLAIVSSGTSTTAFHGVTMWVRVNIDNCYISGFCGDGVHIFCVNGAWVEPHIKWTRNTQVARGEQYENGGKLYFCKTPGITAASGGPTGTGTNITDNTVVWDYMTDCLDRLPTWTPSTTYKFGDSVQGALPAAWATGVSYSVGAKVSSGGFRYECTTAGTSGATAPYGQNPFPDGFDDGGAKWKYYTQWYWCVQGGASAASGGPTGFAYGIVDGGAIWNSVQNTNANGWNVSNTRIEAGRAGIWIRGADSNAGTAYAVDVSSNIWGIYDSSFLGNTFIGCQVSDMQFEPYKCDNANAPSIFIGCYAENSVIASNLTKPSVLIGGLQGNGIEGSGYRMVANRSTYIEFPENGVDSQYTIGYGASAITYGGYDNAFYWGKNNSAGVHLATWNWAGVGVMNGHGMALDQSATYTYGVERPRYAHPTSLMTFKSFGLLNEGKRISHSATPEIPTLGFGDASAAVTGDLIFKRTMVAGDSMGWVCTVDGTPGTYTGGLTATANGTTALTLSGTNHVTWGLQVGERILVNGADRFIVARPTPTTLTLDGTVPAGSGLAIAYVAPTYVKMPLLQGGIADSSGSPGNATQNAYRGCVAIAAAASSVVITNSNVSAGDFVSVTIQSNDTTLKSAVAVTTANTITITGNAAATADCKVFWKLEQ